MDRASERESSSRRTKEERDRERERDGKKLRHHDAGEERRLDRHRHRSGDSSLLESDRRRLERSSNRHRDSVERCHRSRGESPSDLEARDWDSVERDRDKDRRHRSTSREGLDDSGQRKREESSDRVRKRVERERFLREDSVERRYSSRKRKDHRSGDDEVDNNHGKRARNPDDVVEERKLKGRVEDRVLEGDSVLFDDNKEERRRGRISKDRRKEEMMVMEEDKKYRLKKKEEINVNGNKERRRNGRRSGYYAEIEDKLEAEEGKSTGTKERRLKDADEEKMLDSSVVAKPPISSEHSEKQLDNGDHSNVLPLTGGSSANVVTMPLGPCVVCRSGLSRSDQEESSLPPQTEPEYDDQILNNTAEVESAIIQNAPTRRTRGANREMPVPESVDKRILVDFEQKGWLTTVITRDITVILKKVCKGPWAKPTQIPDDIIDVMWDRFKTKFRWDEKYNNDVKWKWRESLFERYRNAIYKARQHAIKESDSPDPIEWYDYSPNWIYPHIWRQLIDEFWVKEGWKNKSIKGRQNRLTKKDGSISKHTGGTIPFVVHKRNIEKEKGAPATHLEVFNRTHRTKGGKGDFVDGKSKKVYDTYQAIMEKKYPDITQAPAFDTFIWADAIGPVTRGRVYGFGTSRPSDILGDTYSTQSSWSRTSRYRGSESSSTSRSDEEVNRIIEERVREQMEQIRKQMEDSQRAQVEKIFNERMAEAFQSFMLTQQASFVPPFASAHRPTTIPGSPFPVPCQWHPNYGVYGAPSHGSFGGHAPFGKHGPFGGSSSDSSGGHQNDV